MLVEHKKDYTMLLLGGVAHGFATRADPGVPKQREYCHPALAFNSTAVSGVGVLIGEWTGRVGDGAGGEDSAGVVRPPC